MRVRITSILLSFLLVSASSFARPARSRAWTPDSSYSSALRAANRFLHAWQAEDHETGILMLTDQAREQASPDKLQEFFSPGDHAAYEIKRGRRLNAGEYVFPVVLFGTSQNSQPRAGRLLIIHAGKNEWAVNRLP
ncbi:MAG TPA: hypothetical protein VN708_24900 [Terriglobales bacterium]|jgi:hypothetical protein|nr:hypothetical protein [Terriglobales bacterium]